MKTEDWGDKAISPGAPKIANKHQELGRGREGLPMAFREVTSGPQNCETTHFCCLKSPSSWDFVKTALGNDHTSKREGDSALVETTERPL